MSRVVDTDLGKRLTALEGLRAVAVFAVVVTHAGFLTGITGGRTLAGLVARMDFGVAVFFVLSGFLLYLPHARAAMAVGRAPALRDYGLRRAARILPAFWLCLVGTLFIVPQSRSASPQAWAATAGLVQTLDASWSIAPLNHLWSLSTEVAFYLALPFLGGIIGWRRRRHRWADPVRQQLTRLAALAVIVWVFRGAVGTGHGPGLESLSWLPGHLDWFAAGMAMAVLRTAAPLHAPAARIVDVVRGAPVAARLLAVVLLWLATTKLAGPYDLTPSTATEDLFKHLLYLLAAVFLVAPSAFDAGDGVSRALSTRPMVWLGTVSYAVFLWHLPLMFAVQSGLRLELFGGHFWQVLLVTLVVTVPVAAASWHLLEHPVLRWAHRLTRRAPDPVPDGGPEGLDASRAVDSSSRR